jgi:NTP pyrophosphatase (non-canonical NTP hydrolase)
MEHRSEIVAAVRARGYFDGWSDEELIARNVVKLVEEVCEAVIGSGVGSDNDWPGERDAYWFKRYANEYQGIARRFFDGGYCGRVRWNRTSLVSELHDVYVVLCCLESLLGVDLAAGALGKATGDVERGVR